jgi:hypothetical protein
MIAVVIFHPHPHPHPQNTNLSFSPFSGKKTNLPLSLQKQKSLSPPSGAKNKSIFFSLQQQKNKSISVPSGAKNQFISLHLGKNPFLL